MAPKIQPESLFQISLNKATDLLHEISLHLYLENETFYTDHCQLKIEAIQDHLVDLLPLSVFEKLAENRGRFKRLPGHYMPLNFTQEPCLGRIKVGMFLHPTITKLRVNADELVMGVLPYSASENDAFWFGRLQAMTNLVRLDLNQLATDEILKIVSQCCPKLEALKFASRLKRQAALHVMGCVSDEGLLNLLKCHHLKQVHVDGLRASLPGARRFILGLPNLEEVNFEEMGSILQNAEPERELRLKCFTEINPICVHIDAIRLLCPNLQQLTLKIRKAQEDDKICRIVMETLALSDLKLKFLITEKYPFSESYKKMLERKGQGLTTLSVETLEDLDIDDVEYIARTCPNLSSLSISTSERRTTVSVLNLPKLKRCQYFRNLKSLSLFGLNGKTESIILMTLLGAHQIQSVYMQRFTSGENMDRVLQILMANNRLDHLNKLEMTSSFSPVVIEKLIHHCPKLRVLSLNSDPRHAEEFGRLSKDLRSQNYDIQIKLIV